jgi:hypothetical protein
MNEDPVLSAGRTPSLTESIIRFLKSRVLVSSKPIIWIPDNGSPEKGTVEVLSILSIILIYVSVVKLMD